MLLALLALAFVALVLALPGCLQAWASWREKHGVRRRARRVERVTLHDPGRERRAEQRARELLRSCVNEEEWEMYRDLGFIKVDGKLADGAPRRDGGAGGDEGEAPYAYLIYPHKPIVAYVPKTRRLLSEYCVEFPDLTRAISHSRLPDSDDVLAKWMALTGDERNLIRKANMHLPGRQIDPARVRRDLWRLAEWERQRRGSGSYEARRR
ncbi:MAG: hypothetical protein IRZ21_12680 [Thermoleophilaceae bacterium]|nr:hypothetical protein [Thermoleophilaceae bacterium]